MSDYMGVFLFRSGFAHADNGMTKRSKKITWLLLSRLQSNKPHPPEPSGTFRKLHPEPTPTHTGTLRNLPEPLSGTYTSTHRNPPEPSWTCFRNLHQPNPPELSRTCHWNFPEPASRAYTTLRNLPEPASGTCLRNLHRHGTFLRNLHQHTPEPSGTCLRNLHQHTHRNPRNLPPEPTPARTRTLRNLPLEPTPAQTGTLAEPSRTCFRNLHQPNPPELSRTCHWNLPEPASGTYTTLRNLPELASGTYTSTEPSGTCLRNLHQHTPEPSGTSLRNLHQHTPELASGTYTSTHRNLRNLPPEPAPAHTGTLRNLPPEPTPPHAGNLRNLLEPSSGTCSCDPHRHTPELIWAEDPISLRCWGKMLHIFVLYIHNMQRYNPIANGRVLINPLSSWPSFQMLIHLDETLLFTFQEIAQYPSVIAWMEVIRNWQITWLFIFSTTARQSSGEGSWSGDCFCLASVLVFTLIFVGDGNFISDQIKSQNCILFWVLKLQSFLAPRKSTGSGRMNRQTERMIKTWPMVWY